jgi:hypothetical protein
VQSQSIPLPGSAGPQETVPQVPDTNDWIQAEEGEKTKGKEPTLSPLHPLPEDNKEPIEPAARDNKDQEEEKPKHHKPLPERPVSPRGRKPEVATVVAIFRIFPSALFVPAQPVRVSALTPPQRPSKPLPQAPQQRVKSPTRKGLPMTLRARGLESSMSQTLNMVSVYPVLRLHVILLTSG